MRISWQATSFRESNGFRSLLQRRGCSAGGLAWATGAAHSRRVCPLYYNGNQRETLMPTARAGTPPKVLISHCCHAHRTAAGILSWGLAGMLVGLAAAPAGFAKDRG